MKNDIEKKDLVASVDSFAGVNASYYRQAFENIQQSETGSLYLEYHGGHFWPIMGGYPRALGIFLDFSGA
jgi:hypothetical protein